MNYPFLNELVLVAYPFVASLMLDRRVKTVYFLGTRIIGIKEPLVVLPPLACIKVWIKLPIQFVYRFRLRAFQSVENELKFSSASRLDEF